MFFNAENGVGDIPACDSEGGLFGGQCEACYSECRFFVVFSRYDQAYIEALP